LETLVTLIGTPSSSTKSKKTCICNSLPHILRYVNSLVSVLKPTLDKPLDHLNSIVAPRITLKNITLYHMGNKVVWIRVRSNFLSYTPEILGQVLLLDPTIILENYSTGHVLRTLESLLFAISLENL
jgi:hypothetical protein